MRCTHCLPHFWLYSLLHPSLHNPTEAHRQEDRRPTEWISLDRRVAPRSNAT